MNTEKQKDYDVLLKKIKTRCMFTSDKLTYSFNLRDSLWDLQIGLMEERFKLGFSAPTRKKEKTGEERMANSLSIKLPANE
ncbi:hypothetical protein GQ473_02525 [archaeon]|nr:hypothetical protein [archaeon]